MTKRQEAVTIIANAGGVAWATVCKAFEFLPHGTFADEIGTDAAGGQAKAEPSSCDSHKSAPAEPDLCPACGMDQSFAAKNNACGRPDDGACAVPTLFLSLPDNVQSYWIAEADEFLSSQKWSWHTDTADSIMLSTAIYLYHMSQLLNRIMTYPCYVVHSQDHDWRFVSSDYAPAFKRFKSSIRRGERVGLFHWIHANKCERIGVGNEYALTHDFGEQK